MKIVIKTKNLKLNLALENFICEKLNSLEKFAEILHNHEEKYFNNLPEPQRRVEKSECSLTFGKGKPSVEAWVEIGKETRHHKKGPYFWAECQMRFSKKSLRSVAQSENLKTAINEVKDELQRQLKQYKNKLIAQTKKGARVLKKEIHFSPRARFYRKGRIREEGI